MLIWSQVSQISFFNMWHERNQHFSHIYFWRESTMHIHSYSLLFYIRFTGHGFWNSLHWYNLFSFKALAITLLSLIYSTRTSVHQIYNWTSYDLINNVCQIISHHSHITWVPWYLKSLTTQLYIQLFFQTNHKENINTLADSPYKRANYSRIYFDKKGTILALAVCLQMI